MSRCTCPCHREDDRCDECCDGEVEKLRSENDHLALESIQLAAKLARYRNREGVHIRPLLSAMRSLLMFPGYQDSATAGEVLERIKLASEYDVD